MLSQPEERDVRLGLGFLSAIFVCMRPLPVRVFKATITVAVSAVKSAVRDAEDLGGSLHL